jgi:hypothetical protein
VSALHDLITEVTRSPDAEWPTFATVRDLSGRTVGAARARLAALGELADTYPCGLADLQLDPTEDSSAQAVEAIALRLFELNPRCRRIVCAIDAGNLTQTMRMENAGLRFAVDVETVSREVALLVAEPGWVLVQPSAIEDIPL